MMLLGTANFGQTYAGKSVDTATAFRLLDMAHEAGWGVETSVLYGGAAAIVFLWPRIPHFLIIKSNVPVLCHADLFMSHGKFDPVHHQAQSIYEPHEAKCVIVEAPFSILNQSCAPLFENHEVYARSVFARGAAFTHEPLLEVSTKTGYSIPELCLGFVESFNPAGIVVGVESIAQLQELISLGRFRLPEAVLDLLNTLDLRLDLRRTFTAAPESLADGDSV